MEYIEDCTNEGGSTILLTSSGSIEASGIYNAGHVGISLKAGIRKKAAEA